MVQLVLIALLVSLSIGCTAVRETQPVRTATEQFILSHAVIDAARQIEADAVAGKKVMLDLSMLKTVDVEFAHGELRDRLLQLGADLVAESADAEIIVEARSSGVGIDKSETMLGIPAIPIPVPGVGTFSTPELPVFKRDLQHGRAGISITGFERATGKHVLSIGPVYGNAIRDNISILGIPLYRGRENLPK